MLFFMQIKTLMEKNRLTMHNGGSKKLYILVTSDRGLAGSYHNQLFKAFLAEVKDVSKDDYQVL